MCMIQAFRGECCVSYLNFSLLVAIPCSDRGVPVGNCLRIVPGVISDPWQNWTCMCANIAQRYVWLYALVNSFTHSHTHRHMLNVNNNTCTHVTCVYNSQWLTMNIHSVGHSLLIVSCYPLSSSSLLLLIPWPSTEQQLVIGSDKQTQFHSNGLLIVTYVHTCTHKQVLQQGLLFCSTTNGHYALTPYPITEALSARNDVELRP